MDNKRMRTRIRQAQRQLTFDHLFTPSLGETEIERETERKRHTERKAGTGRERWKENVVLRSREQVKITDMVVGKQWLIIKVKSLQPKS